MATIGLKTETRMFAVFAAAALLSACGSTTETPFVDPFEDRRQNFADYATLEASRAAIDDLTRAPFTPNDLTGKASYDGVFLISTDQRTGGRLGGEVSFDVSFDDGGSFTGSATNFRRETDNVALTGVLDLSADTATPQNVSASVIGTLALPNGTAIPYDTRIGGAFREDTATGFSGESGIFLPEVVKGVENYATLQIYATGAGVTK